MRPYQKGPGLRPVLIGNLLALVVPWVCWGNGLLQPGQAATYASLALQVIPLFNLLRLIMRTSMGIRAHQGQLVLAWLLCFGCIASALWWIPRYTGIYLQ